MPDKITRERSVERLSLKVADALDAAVVLAHGLVVLDAHPEAERQLRHAPDKHDL